MATIKSENWDGVTAPAIPAGWTVDTQLKTSSSIASTTPSNSFGQVLADVNISTVPYAVWATQDGASGNVQVSTNVYLQPTGGGVEQDFIMFARSPNVITNANRATQTAYSVSIARGVANPFLQLFKSVSGTNTALGTVIVTLADNTWYRIYLSCNGTTISAKCKRVSDGFWLNDSGVFVSDPAGTTTFVSVTDSSITGQGYAGMGFYLASSTTSGSLMTDDFLLEDFTSPPPPPSTDTAHPVKVFYGGMPQ